MRKMAAVVLAGAMAFAMIGWNGVALAGDNDVERRGSCSGSSDWKLKLSPEDGGLEVEYEVDQNVTGDRWRVKIRHDGELVFNGVRTTRGASGFGPDGEEELYVAGEAPGLLLTQLGDATVRTVAISSEPLAPYRTRHTVELCGLAGSAMPSLTQEACSVCGASRPPAGCLFCGSGVDSRSLTPAGSGSIGGAS